MREKIQRTTQSLYKVNQIKHGCCIFIKNNSTSCHWGAMVFCRARLISRLWWAFVCSGPVRLPNQTHLITSKLTDKVNQVCLSSKNTKLWWTESPQDQSWMSDGDLLGRYPWFCAVTHKSVLYYRARTITGQPLRSSPHCQWSHALFQLASN